ncbi:relaxase/mobilization nuclease domain-containing protein [Trichocoleus desertorum AS-A10]|uniref:relaxase/mobilization nuclease domain-containing protein n=1 Tax=Trichocoleus desertorum TaxID=1481672 RepID=UPI00329A6388
MIGKTLQNHNFRETTQYVLDKEAARLLGGTVMGSDSDTISREFLLSRDLNPGIERPVYHLIDAYSYEDAVIQELSDEFLKERAIARFAGLVVSARKPELLRREDKTAYKQQVNEFIEMELYEYQWFCAVHEDTKHLHTHFVASRINLLDGRAISTWQDHERSQRICRETEKEYGLQPLKSSYEIERRSPTRRQVEAWQKTGIPPVMVVMQNAIDQEAIPGHNLEQLQAALLQNHGITLRECDRPSKPGIIFEQADTKGEMIRMSGSQLGRGYTLPALQQRLERERDVKRLGVQLITEGIVELDPVEDILRVQNEYVHRLVPQIQAIWNREKMGRGKLKAATFEDYQIRLGEEGQPELFHRDRLIMGYSEGKYQSYGLTEQDCTAIEQFHERLCQQALPQPLDPEKQKHQESHPGERSHSRSQHLEL